MTTVKDGQTQQGLKTQTSIEKAEKKVQRKKTGQAYSVQATQPDLSNEREQHEVHVPTQSFSVVDNKSCLLNWPHNGRNQRLWPVQ